MLSKEEEELAYQAEEEEAELRLIAFLQEHETCTCGAWVRSEDGTRMQHWCRCPQKKPSVRLGSQLTNKIY